MIARAALDGTISYSELMAQVTAIRLDANDPRIAAFLDEIAVAEDKAGRGLLTAVVVYKTGTRMPGPGFFELALSRGRDISDATACWLQELRRLNDYWRAQGSS